MNKSAEILYPILLLLVFGVLFFTALPSTVVIDYDEGVYAEVSRMMYQKAQPVIPELNGEGFFEKPPMLYWAQMLGYKVFGVNSLGVRFFNATAGLATLLVFYLGAARPLGGRMAFNATLVLGSSIIFTYLARVAMTDMFLTLFLTLCLICSWYGVERAMQDKGGTVLFLLGCLFGALAMLSKGAIGALFPVLTALIYLVSIGRPAIIFRKTWFLPGAAILTLVGFSWYLLLGFTHPDGFAFMKELFIKHHMGRFSQPMEGHSGSIFYYLIVLLVGFMPWFGYLLLALALFAVKGLSLKTDGPQRYLRLHIIISLVVFIFFSIAATKLPNYILPALPGFALLIAWLFDREQSARPLIWRIAGWVSVLPVVLLGLVLAAAPLIYPYLAELLGEDALRAPALSEAVDLGLTPYLAAALFLLSAFLIVRAVGKNQPARLFETLVLSSFINVCTIFFLVIPLYDSLFDAPLARLAERAAEHTPTGGKIVVFEIDDRPSISFVSGLATIEHDQHDFRQLPQRFADPGVSVGLTSVFYFERLQEQSIPLIELARDTGFVLFRPPDGQLDHHLNGQATIQEDTSENLSF